MRNICDFSKFLKYSCKLTEFHWNFPFFSNESFIFIFLKYLNIIELNALMWIKRVTCDFRLREAPSIVCNNLSLGLCYMCLDVDSRHKTSFQYTIIDLSDYFNARQQSSMKSFHRKFPIVSCATLCGEGKLNTQAYIIALCTVCRMWHIQKFNIKAVQCTSYEHCVDTSKTLRWFIRICENSYVRTRCFFSV